MAQSENIEKIWFKNYQSGCNKEIDTSQYHSLVDLFQNSVENYSNKVAYSNYDTELTYHQVDKLSSNFGAYLQNELNIQKGDRVALMCPNTLSFTVAMWGIIRVGGVQVNVNPLYTSNELEHQLNDAQVETIVIFSESTKTLADIIDKTNIKKIIVIYLDDLIENNLSNVEADTRLKKIIPFTDALAQGKGFKLKSPDLTQQDLLFLQYTGGTTGLSKGAMLSHGNLIANILQYQEMIKPTLVLGKEIVMTAIPMYHIFALSVNTLSYFSFGAKNILITQPRDMADFVQTWKKFEVTAFTGVNTLFNGLLHTAGFSDIDFSTLKISIGGGAPVQDAVSLRWKGVTGKRIKEGYGLSETSPVLALNNASEANYVSGIGVPVPSTDISIRDDNEKEVPQGETGELCAKGPQIMQGYWRNPEETRSAMTKDGYFKTGDIALLDDEGYFHIVDRKKDMILVSGFNVYPNEIEAVVANMSGILESACIGVEDEITGEAAKLFVVKNDKALTEKDIIDYCRSHLTGYKVPKQIVFIDELPKSTVGKLLRRELRKI